MIHSFDSDIAEKYGTEEAIIVHNFVYWMAKNKANKKHLHEGKVWTYNTQSALLKLFPYLKNTDKIGRILRKLASANIIEIAQFNKSKNDQTNWYTVVDKWVLQIYRFDNANMHTEECKNARSDNANLHNDNIKTDSKPNRKPNRKQTKKDDVFFQDEKSKEKTDSEVENLFKTFWQKYPLKTSKADAEIAFARLMKDKSTREQNYTDLMRALDCYIMTKEDWRNYLHASTFINKSRFRDYLDQQNTQASADTAGMSYREIVQKLDGGLCSQDGWGAYPAESSDHHRKRVLAWLEVGLIDHWDIESQSWSSPKSVVLPLFDKADRIMEQYS